ncbi:hypothetical protein GCM10010409_21610 [Mycolicibacterium diernhoferi]
MQGNECEVTLMALIDDVSWDTAEVGAELEHHRGDTAFGQLHDETAIGGFRPGKHAALGEYQLTAAKDRGDIADLDDMYPADRAIEVGVARHHLRGTAPQRGQRQCFTNS